jgi:hypothetical protein
VGGDQGEAAGDYRIGPLLARENPFKAKLK